MLKPQRGYGICQKVDGTTRTFGKKDKIDDDVIFCGQPSMRHYCHRGCAYTVLQTVRSLQYTVLFMVPYIISYSTRVGHSSDFCIVLTSGFLLSRYCHDCAERDVKQYSLIHSYVIRAPLNQTTLHL